MNKLIGISDEEANNTMADVEFAKRKAAEAALSYIDPDQLLGVGTGSTVSCFIEAMILNKVFPAAAIPTSAVTEKLLLEAGIKITQHEEANQLIPVYIDSADFIDYSGRAIKGGGGAHRIEKQVACSSRTWVCIIDESKLIDQWQEPFPLPLEIIPTEYNQVAAQVKAMGGRLIRRISAKADSGNLLADIHEIDLTGDLKELEIAIERIPGVAACGIFAIRKADIILVGSSDGTVILIEPGR
ncbi:MAG: ribose 5-phosphate isomerase A [Dethiobacteria bacterium]